MQEYKPQQIVTAARVPVLFLTRFYLTIPAEHLKRMSAAGEIHAVDTLLYGWAFRLERQLHNNASV